MSKFKVGDWVMVARDNLRNYGNYGKVVEAPSAAGGGFVRVQLDGYPGECIYLPDELKLIPTTDFNAARDEAREKFNEESLAAAIHQLESKGVGPSLVVALDEIRDMMLERDRKYGAGNIAKHGTTGIHVRMDDKFSRLETGAGNFDDETVENTLDDIIGYALIWKLWLRKQWPGSEAS